MDNKYVFPKKEFDTELFHNMELYFENGDYVKISGMEIKDMDISLADRLIWKNDRICFVASGGQIKLRINYVKQVRDYEFSVENRQAYLSNKKQYIEDRCTMGGIDHVVYYVENGEKYSLYGNISATKEGEFLLLKFLPLSNFENTADDSYILLDDVKKDNENCEIRKILLDFENCEGFYVYDDEILDISLDLKKQLAFEGDLVRELEGGYIKLQLDKDYDHQGSMFASNKNNSIKYLERRICGKKGFSDHDICHLYVTYESGREECITIYDIRPENQDANVDEDEYDDNWFVGGFASKLADGSIIITFGKTAKEDLKKYNV